PPPPRPAVTAEEALCSVRSFCPISLRGWSLHWLDMTAIVPQPDRRLGQFVLIAQRAEARSAQQEVPAARRVETEPAGREYPQEMPARKNQHVAFDRAHPAHDAIGPRADLARRLSSGTAVTEELPVRALGMDLSRA